MKTPGVQTERGFVLVATAIFAVVLLGFVGLAIDVGYLQMQKLAAQSSADSACYGAVQELKKGSSNATIVLAGQSDAALNGFTNGVSGAVVAVNSPPLQGPLAGNSQAVEVVITKSYPSFFMSVLGQKQTSVSVRAVGAVTGGGGGGGCVYTLNQTAPKAFQIDGGNTDYFSCGLQVASSSATALHMEGSATLYMKNNAGVGVVGSTDLTGQTQILAYPSGTKITATKLGSLPDPLASVAAPSMNGLTVRGNSNTYYDMNKKPTGNTIQPGIYCGGLSVGNTGGATFTMAAGVYVMAGGGFTFNSQAQIFGTGVTIYNTSGANSGVPGCNSSFAAFNIDGQANLNLSAPTSGSLEGILIFQDRSITSSLVNQLAGGSSTLFNGAIYLPHSPLLFSGSNNNSGYQILVADTITVSGNSALNADYSSLQDGSPIGGSVKTGILAE